MNHPLKNVDVSTHLHFLKDDVIRIVCLVVYFPWNGYSAKNTESRTRGYVNNSRHLPTSRTQRTQGRNIPVQGNPSLRLFEGFGDLRRDLLSTISSFSEGFGDLRRDLFSMSSMFNKSTSVIDIYYSYERIARSRVRLVKQ